MKGKIYHPDYEIEYFEYGQGPRTMLAFHGFDNHAEDFKPLADSLINEYKIIAVNLFFHGESKVAEHVIEKGFHPDDLKKLFDELEKKFPAEKYSLAGYSMGGRIVLKLLEIYPEKIEEIILIAPDGIKVSPMYTFLTQTRIGKTLFRKVIKRPSVFFTTANFLKAIKILPENKYKFVVGNFNSHQKREKVYSVWMVFRKILSKMEDLKSILKKHSIDVYLFFGKYDKIIPVSIGKNFKDKIGRNFSLHVLDAGHNLMKPNTLLEISKTLVAKKNDAVKKTAS